MRRIDTKRLNGGDAYIFEGGLNNLVQLVVPQRAICQILCSSMAQNLHKLVSVDVHLSAWNLSDNSLKPQRIQRKQLALCLRAEGSAMCPRSPKHCFAEPISSVHF